MFLRPGVFRSSGFLVLLRFVVVDLRAFYKFWMLVDLSIEVVPRTLAREERSSRRLVPRLKVDLSNELEV